MTGTTHEHEKDDVSRMVQAAFSAPASPDVEERMRSSLRTFHQNLHGHPYARGRRSWASVYSRVRSLHLGRWLTAGTGVAAAILVLALVIWPGDAQPAWGAVANQLKDAPPYALSIYFKDGAVCEPKQIELWSDQHGRIRGRVGTQVLFAQQDRTIAFDVKTGKEAVPDPLWVRVLEQLKAAGGITLESIIKTLPGDCQISEAARPATEVTKGLLVYDASPPGASAWIRMWVLKDSKLPTRVLVWKPRDGQSVDVAFSYERSFGKNAFDPDEFAKELKASQGGQVSPYLLLDAASGPQLTQQDTQAPETKWPATRPVGGYTFGPVRQAVLTLPPNQLFVDFDTAALLTPPQTFDDGADMKDHGQRLAWTKASGADAMATKLRKGLSVMIWALDMATAEIDGDQWETIKPDEVLQHLTKSKHLGEDNLYAGKTYAFRTRQKGVGIIQVEGLAEGAVGVNIRYKMISTGSAPDPAAQSRVGTPAKKITAENEKELLAQIQKIMERGSATMEDVLRICGQPDASEGTSGDSAKPYRTNHVLGYDCLDSKTNEVVRIKVMIGDNKVSKITIARERVPTQPSKAGDRVPGAGG